MHIEQPDAYMVVKNTIDFECAYLTADRRCRVYRHRPQICRSYGTDPNRPCWRCQPGRAGDAAIERDAIRRIMEKRYGEVTTHVAKLLK